MFTFALIGSFVHFSRRRRRIRKNLDSCQWIWWMILFIASRFCFIQFVHIFTQWMLVSLGFQTHVNMRKFDFPSIPSWQILSGANLKWDNDNITHTHFKKEKNVLRATIGMYRMRAPIHRRFTKHNRFTCLAFFTACAIFSLRCWL